jgi:hypothetical protein
MKASVGMEHLSRLRKYSRWQGHSFNILSCYLNFPARPRAASVIDSEFNLSVGLYFTGTKNPLIDSNAH